MNRIVTGLVVGVVAGVADVIPMILQGLTWDANLSAFCMWIVVGFLVSISNLKLSGFFKGILVAYLVLSPSAIIIGWKEPLSLLPIGVMTLILGAFVGWSVERFGKNADI